MVAARLVSIAAGLIGHESNKQKLKSSFFDEEQVGVAIKVVLHPAALLSFQMRVRAVLSAADKRTRNALLKLIPAEALMVPDVETAKYPSALLSALPKPDAYAYLGLLTEHLLRLPAASVSDLLRIGGPYLTAADSAEKVQRSKTTAPFMELIARTRALISPILGADAVAYEPTLAAGHVEGHPDMKTATQVLEVKLTGQLKKNWRDFVLQTFAYAALDAGVTHAHVVLPLQAHVASYDVRGWSGRAKYLALLERVAAPTSAPAKPKVPKGRSMPSGPLFEGAAGGAGAGAADGVLVINLATDPIYNTFLKMLQRGDNAGFLALLDSV